MATWLRRSWAAALVCASALAAACSSTDSGLFGDDGDAAPGDATNAGDSANTGRDSSAPPDEQSDGQVPPDRDGAGADGARSDGATSDGAGADGARSDGATSDAPNDASGDATQNDSGPGDAGVDADCGPPYKVFTNEAGPFCPFTLSGPVNCAVTQHCCEYRADAGLFSTCNEANAACVATPGTMDWGCDEKNDCPTGETCCFVGTVVQDQPSCPVYHGKNVSGTVCRPGGCNIDERVACGTQSDCTSGTCLGMNVRGKDIGFCGP